METQVRTPQLVFMQPQRLVVPLFQRPYVWNEESQWGPLWDDVVRVADRVLAQPRERHEAHFLGAVVLQQNAKQTGLMQERTIIDGQQRLTTLQLLLDALHAQLLLAEVTACALRIEPLVRNAEPFCARHEDRFKVWPTNRDRAAFNGVMSAEPPVDYEALGLRGERMVEAHRFFGEQAREWLKGDGAQGVQARGEAIERVVRELLQMVVIDLGIDENAQEIFETLNARGTPLTAADLVKNFVFQQILEEREDVERVYKTSWQEFETGFWEAEVSVGRLRLPRSSVFLNHWLVARTGTEVVARDVFYRFKRFADFECGLPMAVLVGQVHEAAGRYRDFVVKADATGPIDRLGLFAYRTGRMESEVVKPFVLHLLDNRESAIDPDQLEKALDALESWMVRRMLVRATTKNYNKVVSDLIGRLKGPDRAQAGDVVTDHLVSQKSGSGYWPDDDELLAELPQIPVYRRLGRGRLRMVLEALEDHFRGWKAGKAGLGGERVARGEYAIEHVMPRKWTTHWPAPGGPSAETDRERLIHTIGNLTLITGRLNSKQSNGPWLGEGGKREGLEAHDVLHLNRDLLKVAGQSWTDDAIRLRGLALTRLITEIWPVPAGYKAAFAGEKASASCKKIDLLDLVNAGLLQVGMTLFARGKKHAGRFATVLSDGRLDVGSVVYSTPSRAAVAITGKSTNGWWFFLVDQAAKRSLRAVWREYVEALAVEVDDSETENGEEGEE